MALPVEIWSAAQVREFDALAIAGGTPGYTLMKRAGESALRALRSRWPTAMRVAIVCGAGNNGGDGYVLARFARAAGLEVSTMAAADPAGLRGDAQRAWQDLLASGGTVAPLDAAALGAADVIVDALLGTGTRHPLHASAVAAIQAINAAGRPVLALDLPSGLDAESGAAGDTVVDADLTLTFVGLKTGLFLGRGPEQAGQVLCDALEVVPPAEARPRLLRLTDADIARALPRRARTAHKAQFGRVLIIGGGAGMPGAVHLAGEAALRTGAGLVTVASLPEHLATIVGPRPELMFAPLPDAEPLANLLAQADVVVAGPGLGRSAWSRGILSALLAHPMGGRPLVLDADALNLLAELGPVRRDDWILTPHPGEAARLLGITPAQVQADRPGALAALLANYGGRSVLKGAGTLLGAPGEPPRLCERGNPGMAIPGMGDVLSGTLGAILAQCGDRDLAIAAAVYAHSSAGDAVARGGERGILASDVVRELRNWVNR